MKTEYILALLPAYKIELSEDKRHVRRSEYVIVKVHISIQVISGKAHI